MASELMSILFFPIYLLGSFKEPPFPVRVGNSTANIVSSTPIPAPIWARQQENLETCLTEYVQYIPKPLPTAPGIVVTYQTTETITETVACHGCTLVVEQKTAGLTVRRQRPGTKAALSDAERVTATSPPLTTTTLTLPAATVTTQACLNGEPVIGISPRPTSFSLHDRGHSELEAELIDEEVASATSDETKLELEKRRHHHKHHDGDKECFWHDCRPQRDFTVEPPQVMNAGLKIENPDFDENGKRKWHFCEFFLVLC